MGEAKRRGSFAVRLKEGIQKREAEEVKREKDYQAYVDGLSPEEREKRKQALKFLSFADSIMSQRLFPGRF